jgi:hypothetical protein
MVLMGAGLWLLAGLLVWRMSPVRQSLLSSGAIKDQATSEPLLRRIILIPLAVILLGWPVLLLGWPVFVRNVRESKR